MTLIVKENSRYNYSAVDSINTPPGAKRQVNPYTRIEKTASHMPSYYHVSGVPHPVYILGSGEPIPGWQGTWAPVSDAETSVRAKLAGMLRRGTSSWGLNMVEYKQTMALMSTLLSATVKPLRLVATGLESYAKTIQRKGTKGFVLKTLDDAASAHLAWKFGVVPLMSDIKNTCESFSSLREREVRLMASSGKRKFAATWREGGPTDPYARNNGMQGHIRVRSGARFVLTDEWLFNAEQLGLLNLPAIMLDAVPLSFVLNWWWPVVTWAKYQTQFAGVSAVGAWTTILKQGEWYAWYERDYLNEHFGHKGFCRSMVRVADLPSSMPFPKTCKLPVDKDLGKSLTIIELAGQRIHNLLERIQNAKHG